MKKIEYTRPEAKIIEISVAKVISQSYGNLGYPGGPIEEDEIPGW